MAHIILNDRLVQAENASISIHDRGFRFGDGVFETIAVHGGVPYRFEWHMERLKSGLEAIRIQFDWRNLHDQCRTLLVADGMEEGLLRIQVTRGIGSRGYMPDSTHPEAGASCVIETATMPVISKEPVALWLSSLRKISPDALPVRYKLCQGLNSTLARLEAADHHCADALLLNMHEHICETSSGNLFWRKEGQFFTPQLSCGVLEGSTRAAIMALFPGEVTEVVAGVDALAGADTVFVTNVVYKALPVGRLMPTGLGWDSVRGTSEMEARLRQDIADYTRAHKGEW